MGQLAAQLPQFDEHLTQITFRRTAEGWRADPGQIAAIPAHRRGGLPGLRAVSGRLLCQDRLQEGDPRAFGRDRLGHRCRGLRQMRLARKTCACVMLPSEFTSAHSLEDAEGCARALGCRLDTVPISLAQSAVLTTLAPLFDGTEPGITEENIQSRLRGLMLMALSNKFGEMLLTTVTNRKWRWGIAPSMAT